MKNDNCEKLVRNLHDKKNYIIHKSALKQARDYGLTLKKFHRVIEFNQEAWLKLYIDMNTELRTKAKYDFEKDLFKLMNNSVFQKTMEILGKHRDIRLVSTDRKKCRLLAEPNYHATKWSLENLLAIDMNKTDCKIDKLVFLGRSILHMSQ